MSERTKWIVLEATCKGGALLLFGLVGVAVFKYYDAVTHYLDGMAMGASVTYGIGAFFMRPSGVAERSIKVLGYVQVLLFLGWLGVAVREGYVLQFLLGVLLFGLTVGATMLFFATPMMQRHEENRARVWAQE